MSTTNSEVHSHKTPINKWNEDMNSHLAEVDPEIYGWIEKEKQRQYSCLELIASENFTSRSVMEANGTMLTNKYSEGLPGLRYYGGNEYIDQIELICQKRALECYKLNSEEWGVNVQPYSGSTANFAAMTGILNPNDRIMGLDLPSGGHLSHGYQTAKKKISATSIFFQSMPYQVDQQTGLLDYDKLEENAKLFRPRLIICGASAYPRDWDYARLRKIADQHGAYLMCDMAHVSGLIAGEVLSSPFDFCDIVTTTTHKTLCGPRAGVVFFRKQSRNPHLNGDASWDLESRINQAVFPGCQGGPHNNTIAGIAVALKRACSPEFRLYARQVVANARALAAALSGYGYSIATGGTDNHIVLWDLRPQKLTGSKVEKVCDLASITLNKNVVPGDKSALSPGGVRVGTAALTTRGFVENDFEKVAQFLHHAIEISLRLQEKAGSKLMKDFVAALEGDSEVESLKQQVEEFARGFPMPGVDPLPPDADSGDN